MPLNAGGGVSNGFSFLKAVGLVACLFRRHRRTLDENGWPRCAFCCTALPLWPFTKTIPWNDSTVRQKGGVNDNWTTITHA